MRFQVITLFPELILDACAHGVLGQAWRDQRLVIEAINPRQFTQDVHHSVDDRPFGGGDGMVMMPEPLASSLELASSKVTTPSSSVLRVRRLYLSARGRPFNDALARELAGESEVVLICGRYGGVDQRVIENYEVEEITVGDFVLSGGEFAALNVIDAVGRLLPGVLGNSASAHEESFADGLLEYPQFTRPRVWNEMTVPEVLTSGNHARVGEWRQAMAVLVTAERRPELLKARGLSDLEGRQALRALASLTDKERRVCGLGDEAKVRAVVEEVIREGARRSV